MNTLRRPTIVGATLLAAALTATAGIAPVTAGADLPVIAKYTAAQAANDTGFRAGAAKMVISGLMGTDDPTYPSLGEYDQEDLYMRAIVIDNNGERAAFIGSDLSAIDEGPWALASPRVAAALNTPEENIVITATHIHSDRPQGYSNNPGGGRYGAAKIGDWAVALVTEALASLEPARVGYGTGELHLAINRDTIDPVSKKWTQAGDVNGVTDTELNVLTFYSAVDDLPIGTYFAYPMHPVSGYLTDNTSGDFPAAASRYIEKAFHDDTVAIYNQGAGGDINPRWLRPGTNVLAAKSGVDIPGYELVREDVEQPVRDNQVTVTRPGPEIIRELFEYQQALGGVIGEEAIRVMSVSKERVVDPEIWSARETVTCPGRIRLDNAREGVAGQYTYEGAPDVAMRTGVMGIGDVIIAQVNAEIYVKIGLRMKDQSPFGKTMVVSLANGKANSGYVLDYQSEYHQTFQALGSKLKPGCAEGALADSVTAMAQRYLATTSSLPAAPAAPSEPSVDEDSLAELQRALDETRRAVASSGAKEARYGEAIAQLTAAVGALKSDIDAIDTPAVTPPTTAPVPAPPEAAPKAKAVTSSIAVSGKAFAKKAKPKVTVAIKVAGGKVGGKVALYVAGKKVKSAPVASGKTTITLPSRYAKSIKIKAVYSPSTESNGNAKSSKTVVIKVKKK